jgi:hypothetical protein
LVAIVATLFDVAIDNTFGRDRRQQGVPDNL